MTEERHDKAYGRRVSTNSREKKVFFGFLKKKNRANGMRVDTKKPISYVLCKKVNQANGRRVSANSGKSQL